MTNPIPTKLSIEDVQNVIKKTSYSVLEDSTTTICQLTLKNGYTVTGESACVDPKSFDAAIGRSVAYDNALNKVWGFEGYLLKQRRFEAGL